MVCPEFSYYKFAKQHHGLGKGTQRSGCHA
jgi:hypothetical protein